MKRTLGSTSVFDVEFNYVYCGSVVERSYRHLLRSEEQSPLRGTAVVSQPGERFNGVTETADRSPTITGIVPGSLGGALAGTCCVTTVAYPPTMSTCVTDQHRHLVPAVPTTIYGCASSINDSTARHDTGFRLISSNQVYNIVICICMYTCLLSFTLFIGWIALRQIPYNCIWVDTAQASAAIKY